MIILASPGAIAFRLGGFPVYYYGICIALAALVGVVVSYKIIKKDYKEIEPDIFFDVTTVAIISGFICARIYYCLINFEYYSIHTENIFNFRQGGLAIQGGIFGSFIITSLYCKIKKYPILKLADIISFGIVVAQAIGRWGNFFNSEAYGLPSKHFIGTFIPETLRINGYETYKYFHPTFLYESILNIFIFLILYFIVRKYETKFDGIFFAYYLILYSTVRFYIEALRLDSIVNVGVFHVPQIVCILTIIAASIFLIYKKRITKN